METPFIPRFLVVAGPIGAGKSSFIDCLKRRFKGKFLKVTRTTSRLKKENEQEVKDYNFVNKEEFRSLKDANKFIETSDYQDYSYGTLKNEVEKIAEGQIAVLETDIYTARALYKNQFDAQYIGILPPSIESLRERLKTMKIFKTEEINSLIDMAVKEVEMQKETRFFQATITNDEYEESEEEFLQAIEAIYPGLIR